MDEAQRYVTEQLRDAGWLVQAQPFTVQRQLGVTDQPGCRWWPVRLHRNVRGVNVLATRPGAGDGPVVVVGAHLDTVRDSPGADDNASGVAVVLELARLLAQLPHGRPVTLALFDLEELGQLGSTAAAKRLCASPGVAGMICLESVGYFYEAAGSQRLPAGAGLLSREAVRSVAAAGHRGDFVLVVHRRSSEQAAQRWEQAAVATSSALPAVLLRDPRPDGRQGVAATLLCPPAANLDRSDHAPFWRRGIPALMLTGTADFRNERYHRPDDTPDTLDYERLSAVVVATAVARCGQDSPAW